MARLIVVFALALGCLLVTSTQALAAPPPWYPPVQWIPAPANNYDAGRTEPITTIVIHETDGSFTSATNWFLNPYSHVSSY